MNLEFLQANFRYLRSSSENHQNIDTAKKFQSIQKFILCRQKSKAVDEKKTDRALRDIQPIEVDGSVRFSSVSYKLQYGMYT